MEVSMSGSVASTVFLVLLSVSHATSNTVSLDNFLHCLPSHVEGSNQIFDSIYTPQNSSFESALTAYIKNNRFLNPTIPKPVAIVAPTHESHVPAIVVCAKNHGLQIRIRSGGHDYEGLSYKSDIPFVILDLFNLRSIDIDIASETAWVQTGATLGELYHKIANASKVHAFPGGVWPSVGTGGHFSGGGYGNLMRKFGLSVDNVVDAKLVDVNGNTLDRKSMGEDLFWAIRGGGGASFGVILSWKINLVRVPKTVTNFIVERTIEQGAVNAASQWQQVVHNLVKDIYIRATSYVVNGSSQGEKTVSQGEKTVSVTFIGLYLGKISTLLPLLERQFPELGLQEKHCQEMSWIQSTLFFRRFPKGTSVDVLLERPRQGEGFFKSKSDYVKEVIAKEDLLKIWRNLIKTERCEMEWNPYGGIMDEISKFSTPFPHRHGYLFKIQYYTSWLEANDTDKYLSLAREFHDEMTPYVTKNPREAFLNYRDLDIGSSPSNLTQFQDAEVYGRAYFLDNFARLMKVKANIDPDNFFKNEQSIPPHSSR